MQKVLFAAVMACISGFQTDGNVRVYRSKICGYSISVPTAYRSSINEKPQSYTSFTSLKAVDSLTYNDSGIGCINDGRLRRVVVTVKYESVKNYPSTPALNNLAQLSFKDLIKDTDVGKILVSQKQMVVHNGTKMLLAACTSQLDDASGSGFYRFDHVTLLSIKNNNILRCTYKAEYRTSSCSYDKYAPANYVVNKSRATQIMKTFKVQ